MIYQTEQLPVIKCPRVIFKVILLGAPLLSEAAECLLRQHCLSVVYISNATFGQLLLIS